MRLFLNVCQNLFGILSVLSSKIDWCLEYTHHIIGIFKLHQSRHYKLSYWLNVKISSKSLKSPCTCQNFVKTLGFRSTIKAGDLGRKSKILCPCGYSEATATITREYFANFPPLHCHLVAMSLCVNVMSLQKATMRQIKSSTKLLYRKW